MGSRGPYSHREFIQGESPFLTTHGDKNSFASIQEGPDTHRQSHLSSKGQRKDRQDSLMTEWKPTQTCHHRIDILATEVGRLYEL